MAREDEPPGFDEFDARLRRLREARAEPSPKGEKARSGPSWGGGLQAGIELLGGLAGGLLLGWALDAWLATSPVFLVVGFVLGAAAGMLNAWRWMKRFEQRMRDEPDRGA
ncbi:MAG: AtpZ/AtpI family protein [Geminicoccaceae bacterium]|nr:AtpZ/AtpI family protein [Geminicoccaceae bacterium]MCX8099958.1 AtpZ/AtpI family protein [Geminicoccaceae bacterium]MDW8371793.1 AtpZ/AtpI family protein [Geminicoccaceae bacterium]